MTAPVWKRDEIESPCVNICVVHPESRLCLGCYRSIDEIRDWSKMTAAQRRTIMDSLPERAESARPTRRGGRNRTRN